ncbi:MAG: molybdate ABC transporter permease subunit [Candidatus Eisenbacteria bacterium]|nr:molybdate ABC transporter permease subunit [Candidatus Eisenbacteria bacterium]
MTTLDPGRAILLSLQVGLACMLLGLPFAIAFGWLLARRRLPMRSLISTLLMIPLVLPPVVTGLLLLRGFGRGSWMGPALESLGLSLTFNLAAAILAALVVGLPLYILVARGAFEAVDPRYEEVSLTLGHSPFRTFRRVTLPLALPGLAAGAVLVFARALGEFGATAVVAGNIEGKTRTISLAVYSLLEMPGGDAMVGRLVMASVVLSLAGLLAYEFLLRWQRRRLELPLLFLVLGLSVLLPGASLARRIDIVGVGELAGENARVLDMFGRLKLSSMEIIAGYAKTPLFISGRNEGEDLTPIPERSQVANALWPNRDLGVELRWAPKESPVEGTLWFGNGTSNYRANDNSLLAAAARADLLYGRAKPGRGKEAMGLRSGLCAYLANVAPRSGLSGRTISGSPWYAAPRINGQRLLLETHHAIYLNSVYVLAEAGWAREEREAIPASALAPAVPSGESIDSWGYGITVAWTLRGEPRGPARPPKGPDTLLPWNWSGGAVELAVRYDDLALGHGAADVAGGGARGGAIAATWWLIDEWALSLAGYHLEFREPVVTRSNDEASDVLLARTTYRWK